MPEQELLPPLKPEFMPPPMFRSLTLFVRLEFTVREVPDVQCSPDFLPIRQDSFPSEPVAPTSQKGN